MLKPIIFAVVAWCLLAPVAIADTDPAIERSTTEADIQVMLNKLLPIAEDLLLAHGEFFPFGGAMKEAQEVVTISGIDGLNEDQPAAKEVIDLLDLNLRIGAENKQYFATAVLSNVFVVPPGQSESVPAIAVALDHSAGLSMTLVFPYVINGGTVEMGDTFAKANDRKIFGER